MKKLFLSLAALLGAAMICTPLGMADEVDFPLTVTIPKATGVNIVAVSVNSASNQFGTTPVSQFNFNPMTYTTTNNINVWLPDHYYAIDVGVTGGSGSTNITLQYSEGSRPTLQPANSSLGYKTTASFFSITGGPAPEDQVITPLTTSAGSKALLIDLVGGVSITPALLNGGFFRANVGVYAGDDATNLPNGKPFVNTDVPGTYTGTLTVTATVA
ncbi:MAG: hypothetical protein WC450_11245 [Candidatus Omnitrophota bacterium]|jgi:hypothetical protein